MADTKISTAAGQSGGVAETADQTGTFQRKDGLFASPFTVIPAVVPPAAAGTVGGFSIAGGTSVISCAVAAEAMIARDLPSGSTSGQESLGGREWRWVRVVSATDMPGVGRIDVRVFADEEQAAERVLFRAAGA